MHTGHGLCPFSPSFSPWCDFHHDVASSHEENGISSLTASLPLLLDFYPENVSDGVSFLCPCRRGPGLSRSGLADLDSLGRVHGYVDALGEMAAHAHAPQNHYDPWIYLALVYLPADHPSSRPESDHDPDPHVLKS